MGWLTQAWLAGCLGFVVSSNKQTELIHSCIWTLHGFLVKVKPAGFCSSSNWREGTGVRVSNENVQSNYCNRDVSSDSCWKILADFWTSFAKIGEVTNFFNIFSMFQDNRHRKNTRIEVPSMHMHLRDVKLNRFSYWNSKFAPWLNLSTRWWKLTCSCRNHPLCVLCWSGCVFI